MLSSHSWYWRLIMRRHICAALFCFLVGGGLARAADVTLDLAGDRKLTRSVAPQNLRFIVINRLPKGSYTVSVVSKILPIPPLPDIKFPTSGFASAACDELTLAATGLDKATDEKQVSTAVTRIREQLAGGACTDPTTVQMATGAVTTTVNVVEGTYPVSYGTSVTVLITRGSESWEFVFDGGSRGEWLVTYGIAVTPSDDQSYFSKAAGDNKFAV